MTPIVPLFGATQGYETLAKALEDLKPLQDAFKKGNWQSFSDAVFAQKPGPKYDIVPPKFH